MAISALVGFLNSCYYVTLDQAGFGTHLKSLEHQLAYWLKTCGKEKRVYNTQLKVSVLNKQAWITK